MIIRWAVSVFINYVKTEFELKKAYTNPAFTKYQIEKMLTRYEQRVCPYGMECIRRNYPETYALWCDYVAMWKKELVIYVIPMRRTSRYLHEMRSNSLSIVKHKIQIACDEVEFISIDNVCISADQQCHEVLESIIDVYEHKMELIGKQLRYMHIFQQLEEYGHASLYSPNGTKMISDVAELQKVLNWDVIKPR